MMGRPGYPKVAAVHVQEVGERRVNQSRARSALRVAVSTALILLVIARAHPGRLWRSVGDVDVSLLLVGLAATVPLTYLYARKWQMLLVPQGMRVPSVRLWRLYLVGYFFGMFLPTSFGGDIARGTILMRDSPNAAGVTASIVVDRVSGFVGLLLVALAALLSGVDHGRHRGLGVGLAALLAGVVLCGFAVARTAGRRHRGTAEGESPGLAGKLSRASARLLNSLSAYRRALPVLGAAVAIGVFSQVFVVATSWFFARAVHMHVSFATLLFVVPVVTVATLLPVSINGLGVQDVGFVVMLKPFGVDASTALLFSVVWHAHRYAYGLAGGVLYAVGRT